MASPPKFVAGHRTGDPFLDRLKTFKDDGPTDWSTRVDELLYGVLRDELRGQGRLSRAAPRKRPVPQRGREIVAGHGRSAVTSNHVLDEAATVLARRAGYHFAPECVADIYVEPSIEVVEPTREDELDALRRMRKYADQRGTFTDCVSFAIMRRRHIRRAFSFDRHFRYAGFSAPGLM